MKRFSQILIIIIILIVGFWIYFYSGINQDIINLILLNIFVYILKVIILKVINSATKNRIILYSFTIALNITWILFIFLLLFVISPVLAISIVSFLVVAVSLTFRDLINNIASGFMLISKEDFEIGDLIKTNDIEGIVDKITLNYTILKQFDDVLAFIPNKNIFNASIKKYSFKKETIAEIRDEAHNVKKYIRTFSRFLRSRKKFTCYTKNIEILPTINPEMLDSLLNPIFNKYTPYFGIKPDYLVDTINSFDRCVIILLIFTENPNVIFEYLDYFLKDILFQFYKNQVFQDWNVDGSHELKTISKKEG